MKSSASLAQADSGTATGKFVDLGIPTLYSFVWVHLISIHDNIMARENGQYWVYAAQQGFKHMGNGLLIDSATCRSLKFKDQLIHHGDKLYPIKRVKLKYK